jgi:hypothetical protein
VPLHVRALGTLRMRTSCPSRPCGSEDWLLLTLRGSVQANREGQERQTVQQRPDRAVPPSFLTLLVN